MMLRAVVKAHGGWWTFRERMLATTGLRRRVYVAVYKLYLEAFGSYVSVLTTFDGPPRFPHKPMGVFIAPDAKIGRNVTIYQQVTIGMNDLAGSSGFGAPTIGDDVYIGAGAKIIGKVTIGEGARIGAGAIVVHDVPPGATVVSRPATARPVPA